MGNEKMPVLNAAVAKAPATIERDGHTLTVRLSPAAAAALGLQPSEHFLVEADEDVRMVATTQGILHRDADELDGKRGQGVLVYVVVDPSIDAENGQHGRSSGQSVALRPELRAIFEEEFPKHEAALRWLAER
ncbi:MAG: hypothetical protein M3442_12380 [Chloroflexota bacterium]|nr:hypothetical protein [Chloroflexota bacterium]